MAFPTNPVTGQTYTAPGGIQYVFTAQGGWKEVATGSASVAPQAALYGVGAPANTLGIDTDYYVDLATGLLYGPRAGGVWPAASGTAITSNQSLLSGTGAPASGVGGNGNYYIDTASGLLYGPKAAGAWPAASVAAFSATPLLTGTGAPGAGVGVNGNYYVDLASGLVYGPKAAGSWPAATGLSVYASSGLIVGVGAPGAGVGVNGQYALDPSNGALYGPKAAGAWPGTAATNLFSVQSLLTGTGAPSNVLGNNGNYYLDSATGLLYGPKAAGAWPGAPGQGISAPQSLFTGAGVPANSLGNNGCYYVDTASGLLYGPKAAGVWPGSPTLLIPQANTEVGTTAGAAPSNSLGSNGSYFFDLNSGLTYGPKAAGAWPATPILNGQRTTAPDTSPVMSAVTNLLAYTSISAPRTPTLPAANAVPAGRQITVCDESGNCTAVNSITVTRAGSDTINGATGYALITAYGAVTFESNGSNAWTIVSSSVGPSSAFVGAIVDFPCNVAPAGWLECNGALISRTTFAALWAFANASGNIVSDATWTGGGGGTVDGSFSSGDGATTFRCPNARGNFRRGWDNGRGLDSGRGIGTTQNDAVGPHTHTVAMSVTTVVSPSGATNFETNSGTTATSQPVAGAGVSTENRPRNIALMTCIKT